MHFSINDTAQLNEEGNGFVAYNIHVNGFYHCSVRYRQLFNLHKQLYEKFGGSSLPSFPPKKLLTLTPAQISERQSNLEKYILGLSQNAEIANSDNFNGWMVYAQTETFKGNIDQEDVHINVYIMNEQKISIQASCTLQTSDLLHKVCLQLGLNDDLHKYFSLFLVEKEEFKVIKKLQDIESPYITQKYLHIPARIYLLKNYWSLDIDEILWQHSPALNILYAQTVAEVEKGWILANRDILHQLTTLQAKGEKREYLELTKTLKYYSYMQFEPCTCDFPEPDTSVTIAAGNNELNFRINSPNGACKEGSFKITRIKCWRISSVKNKDNTDKRTKEPVILELAFEYLMNRDELQWIRIFSSQAALMSICLQGIVHEFISSQNSSVPQKKISSRARKGSLMYMKRDGTSTKVTLNHTGESLAQDNSIFNFGELSWRRLSEKLSDFSFFDSRTVQADVSSVENHAFNVYGDAHL